MLDVLQLSTAGETIEELGTGASRNEYGPAKSWSAAVKEEDDLLFTNTLLKGGLQGF